MPAADYIRLQEHDLPGLTIGALLTGTVSELRDKYKVALWELVMAGKAATKLAADQKIAADLESWLEDEWAFVSFFPVTETTRKNRGACVTPLHHTLRLIQPLETFVGGRFQEAPHTTISHLTHAPSYLPDQPSETYRTAEKAEKECTKSRLGFWLNDPLLNDPPRPQLNINTELPSAAVNRSQNLFAIGGSSSRITQCIIGKMCCRTTTKKRKGAASGPCVYYVTGGGDLCESCVISVGKETAAAAAAAAADVAGLHVADAATAPATAAAAEPLAAAAMLQASDSVILLKAVHQLLSQGWPLGVIFQPLALQVIQNNVGREADVRQLRHSSAPFITGFYKLLCHPTCMHAM